jgi:acetyl esterase/lipase
MNLRTSGTGAVKTPTIRMSSLALAALPLLLTGCMTNAPASGPPYAVSTQSNLAYGPLPAERGDLYRPKGVANPPIVLVIHGGGWVAGDRSGSTALAQLLAQGGLAAFNIDYRLANAASPDTRWPAQIIDARRAVRWLRSHAAGLGIDAAHMGAIGDSAGAHLALLLGVLPAAMPDAQAELNPEQSPNVSAVADLFGPTDVATLPPWVQGIYPALFGTQSPAPDLLASMSPLPRITQASASVLIIQGDADAIVPPAQSQRLADTLGSQGVPTEMVLYSGGHGFEGLDGSAIYALQQRAVTWLAAQLKH